MMMMTISMIRMINLSQNLTRVPEVQSRFKKKEKSSEFNSTGDGLIIIMYLLANTDAPNLIFS